MMRQEKFIAVKESKNLNSSNYFFNAQISSYRAFQYIYYRIAPEIPRDSCKCGMPIDLPVRVPWIALCRTNERRRRRCILTLNRRYPQIYILFS